MQGLVVDGCRAAALEHEPGAGDEQEAQGLGVGEGGGEDEGIEGLKQVVAALLPSSIRAGWAVNSGTKAWRGWGWVGWKEEEGVVAAEVERGKGDEPEAQGTRG